MIDDPNDLQQGEMVAMLRELGRVFLRVLVITFIVLTIATLNGSRMIGG